MILMIVFSTCYVIFYPTFHVSHFQVAAAAAAVATTKKVLGSVGFFLPLFMKKQGLHPLLLL
jgi:hypothetical protein